MVKMCLSRQTLRDFEWIVISPFEYKKCDIWVPEPKKKEGDYYNLNKAWNAGIKKASGELFVSIVDLLWFSPDTLENLWYHYQLGNKQCIGGIGHQYEREENGRPEGLVWKDPRETNIIFRQIPPMDFELCLASIPLKAIQDVGGLDEEFDKYAALSEKEMCLRIEQLGYTFWLDQTIEYRAVQHPRLSPEWDTHYFAGIPYFNECVQEIKQGGRLTLDNFHSTTKIIGVSEKEPAT